MGEAIIRKHLVFTGRVQGVGFRWRAKNAARAAGATGWVQNRYDGSVVMELQGSEEQLDRVLEALDRSPYIQIEGLEARSVPPLEGERGFAALDDDW